MILWWVYIQVLMVKISAHLQLSIKPFKIKFLFWFFSVVLLFCPVVIETWKSLKDGQVELISTHIMTFTWLHSKQIALCSNPLWFYSWVIIFRRTEVKFLLKTKTLLKCHRPLIGPISTFPGNFYSSPLKTLSYLVYRQMNATCHIASYFGGAGLKMLIVHVSFMHLNMPL